LSAASASPSSSLPAFFPMPLLAALALALRGGAGAAAADDDEEVEVKEEEVVEVDGVLAASAALLAFSAAAL